MFVYTNRRRIALLYVLFICTNIKAQSNNTIMIHKGTIRFERRENAYAILEKVTPPANNQYIESYKAKNTQFNVADFLLSFDDSSSYYRPVNPNYKRTTDLDNAASYNEIYTSQRERTFIAKKNLWGQNFLESDSCRKINWRVTDEIKNIAGFLCRRANALIMDSIYIVAFYCVQIVPSIGPESFTGLPGAILGIYMPHEHISWEAKSLSLETVNISTYKSSLLSSETKINKQGLEKIITSSNSLNNSGPMSNLLKILILL